MISRRDFIHAGCAVAAVTLAPNFLDVAEARFPRGTGATPSGFNGGVYQVNLGPTQFGGDYPFLNFLKNCQTPSAADNTGDLAPNLFDANGYLLPGSQAWQTVFDIPAVVNGGSLYAVQVTGKGQIQSGGAIQTIAISTITPGTTTAIDFGASHYFTVGMEAPITGVSGTLGSQLNFAGPFVVSAITSTGIVLNVNTVGKTGSSGTVDYGSSVVGVATGGRLVVSYAGASVSGSKISPGFRQISTDATTPITKMAVVAVGSEEARYNAGAIFGRKFLDKLAQDKPGVLRFLVSQGTNVSNVTTWATRKPVDYISYAATQKVSAIYAGIATGAANDYAITLGSGAPVDKQSYSFAFPCTAITCSGSGTAQLAWTSHGLVAGQPFNIFRTLAGAAPTGISLIDPNTGTAQTFYVLTSTVNSITSFALTKGGAAVVSSSTGSGLLAHPTVAPLACSMASGSTTLHCVGHLLSVNEPIGFVHAGLLPSNVTEYGESYYIKTVIDADNVTISRAPGGAAITFASASSAASLIRLPTLNVNGTGAVPIRAAAGIPTTPDFNNVPRARLNQVVINYGTTTYDSDLNCHLLTGGNDVLSVAGVINGWPPEICVALCKEVGAHPYWTLPPYALDPMTDYSLQLATMNKSYAAANAPWMLPRVEGAPNECWNFLFVGTWYGTSKGWAHWGISEPSPSNWVGKVCSTVGQDWNAVYGGAIGNGYQLIVGVQGSSMRTIAGANGNDDRMNSSAYVAQAAAPQSGYTKSGAKNWATHGTMAQYFNPAVIGTPVEAAWVASMVSFQGQISGNVLTVNSVASGTLAIGQQVSGGLVPWQSTIVSGSGSTWTLSQSAAAAIATELMYAIDPSLTALYVDTCGGSLFTGSISGTTLTVSALTNSSAYIGFNSDALTLTYPGAPAGILVTQQLTGTTGGVGTYQLFFSGTSPGTVGSTAMAAGPFTVPALKQFYAQMFAWCQKFGKKMCGYEGGYSPDYGNSGFSTTDQFRAFSKLVASSPLKTNGVGDWYTDNFNNWVAAGGEFPSEFQFSGLSPSQDAWSYLEDIYQTPPPPQEAALIAFH